MLSYIINRPLHGLAQRISPERLEPVRGGEDRKILATIRDPAVHLAMWHRRLPAALAGIDHLPWDAIDDIDMAVEAADSDRTIAQAIDAAGYPADGMSRALTREVQALAAGFAEIMGCDDLRLRLEIVETDACRKFHADMVTARLLTTFSGPTTQWIHANAPDAIFDMPLGAVGLFKGRLLTDRPRILHRSPPIAGTGKTRLLLVINPATAGADAM